MTRSTLTNTSQTRSRGATLVRLLFVSLTRWWRDQRGSQGISAAGAALAAALIVAALLAASSGAVGPSVERTMECAAGVLSGGGGCAGGAAPTGGQAPSGGGLAKWVETLFGGPTEIADRSTNEPPDSTLKPCPTLPNAGVVDHPVPQNMTDLWDAVNALYQGDKPTQQGPIGITQIGDNRYLVTLSGIEELGFFGSERYNNLNNAIGEAMGGTSPYQEQVMATIRAQIPPGAELVIAGHSEGGIVAQNLAANHGFNRNASSWWNYPWNEARRRLGWGQEGDYRVTHVVSFGSPMSQVPVDGVDYTMITTSADPVSQTGLYGRGGGPLPSQIEIPTTWEKGGFDWRNPFESHSAYGRSLEAIENDPNSPLRDVLELPFGIAMWSKTETFRANDEAREATLACGG